MCCCNCRCSFSCYLCIDRDILPVPSDDESSHGDFRSPKVLSKPGMGDSGALQKGVGGVQARFADSGDNDSLHSDDLDTVVAKGGVSASIPTLTTSSHRATFAARKNASVSHKTANPKGLATVDEIPELQSLPDLFSKLATSKDWIERRDILSVLTDIVLAHEWLLVSCGKLEPCIDRILEKLEDGNVKVALHVVSCLDRLCSEV